LALRIVVDVGPVGIGALTMVITISGLFC